MSIGNSKDYGNKGNNFPWQLKMLQGLQGIINNTGGSSGGPQIRVPYIETFPGTSGGTTGVTFYSLSIANIGAGAGLVNGVSIPAGTTLNFDAGVLNNTLGDIIWDASGTTLLVTGLTI
jgi:hypothetical protein